MWKVAYHIIALRGQNKIFLLPPFCVNSMIGYSTEKKFQMVMYNLVMFISNEQLQTNRKSIDNVHMLVSKNKYLFDIIIRNIGIAFFQESIVTEKGYCIFMNKRL